MTSRWVHKRPRDYYPVAKKLFGEPDILVNKPGGLAIWRLHGNSLFNEHVLHDEDVRHCVPKQHHDFFYTTLKLYVPPSKLLDVLTISGSVLFDGLKHEISARCGSVEANIATLYLAAKVAMGEYTIQEVKREGLYASHIRGEAMSYSDMKKELMRLKKKNHQKYHTQLQLDRYPLAFRTC